MSAGANRTAERWFQAAAAIAVLAMTAWYFMEHRHPAANGHRGLVLGLGWIGIALAALAGALSIRKRMAYQGVGMLSSWMRGHIYAGIAAAFAIFYHSGLRAGGPLTAFLLGSFWLTVVSGLLGWGLSKTVPPLLTAMEEHPAMLEDLIAIRTESVAGILELSAGASGDFRLLVTRRLMKDTVSWVRMLRFYRRRSTLAQELPAFQSEYEPALLQLPEQEHVAFRRSLEYALRANKMSAELLLQRLLRGWLTIHLVGTAALFGLAAVHIISVLYY